MFFSSDHPVCIILSLVYIFLHYGGYVCPASANRLIVKKVNVLELEPSQGRLGNRLVTLTNAIHIALHDAVNCVFLPDDKWPEWVGIRSKTIAVTSEDHQLCIDARADPRLVSTRTSLPGAFWNHKRFDRMARAAEVRNIMNDLFNISSVTVASPDTLHIHMRGGDVFSTSATGMIQPPCSFYRLQINQQQVKQVTIVSEDTANPCVDDVRKSYKHAQYAGPKSLQEDVHTLLGARRLLCGRGTFVPALTMFASNLESIHFCADGDVAMHEFMAAYNPSTQIHNHTECASYYTSIDRLGGWEMEDKMQRDKIMREMLDYKCDAAKEEPIL